jgi:hypothetical protein
VGGAGYAVYRHARDETLSGHPKKNSAFNVNH